MMKGRVRLLAGLNFGGEVDTGQCDDGRVTHAVLAVEQAQLEKVETEVDRFLVGGGEVGEQLPQNILAGGVDQLVVENLHNSRFHLDNFFPMELPPQFHPHPQVLDFPLLNFGCNPEGSNSQQLEVYLDSTLHLQESIYNADRQMKRLLLEPVLGVNQGQPFHNDIPLLSLRVVLLDLGLLLQHHPPD